MFRAKGVMRPHNLIIKPPPPQNRRKRGGIAETVSSSSNAETASASPVTMSIEVADTVTVSGTSELLTPPVEDIARCSIVEQTTITDTNTSESTQLTLEAAIEKISIAPATGFDVTSDSEHIYCPECYLPLHPDPNPEKLYIFLHALKYTISLGSFSTEMPEWAAEGWEWNQS